MLAFESFGGRFAMLIHRLSILVLFILLLLASRTSAQSQKPLTKTGKPAQPPQQSTAQNQPPPEPDKRGTKDSPLIVETRKTDAEAILEKKDREQEAANDRLLRYVSWGLFLIGILQSVIFFLQLKFFKIQTKTLEDSLSLARDTSIRQLRAYVSIYSATITPIQPGQPFTVTIILKNFGQTPAYKFTNRTLVAYAPSFESLTEDPNKTINPSTISKLNLSSSKTSDVLIQNSEPVPQNYFDGIKNDKLGLWVYGKVTYIDAFDRMRTTEYRLVIRGEENLRANRFTFADQGNEET